jgi:hypothetical protein
VPTGCRHWAAISIVGAGRPHSTTLERKAMVEYSNVVFTVTFANHFDMDTVDSLLKSGFISSGDAHRLDNPRVVRLRIYQQKYLETKVLLDELRDRGDLTYVEERLIETAPK